MEGPRAPALVVGALGVGVLFIGLLGACDQGEPGESGSRGTLRFAADVGVDGDADGAICVEPPPGPLPPGCSEPDDGVPIEDCLCACDAGVCAPGGGAKKPLPGGRFNCPAHNMVYCHSGLGLCKRCRPDEDKNPNHFDCDDYALVCAYWMQQNGVDGCHLSFYSSKDPNGRDTRPCKRCKAPLPGVVGHAINSAKKNATQSCLYEPQWNTEICCWTGSPGKVPKSCLGKACKSIGGTSGPDCKIYEIKCNDPSPLPHPGEDPFYVHPAVCKALKERCSMTWPDAGADADADAGPRS